MLNNTFPHRSNILTKKHLKQIDIFRGHEKLPTHFGNTVFNLLDFEVRNIFLLRLDAMLFFSHFENENRIYLMNSNTCHFRDPKNC